MALKTKELDWPKFLAYSMEQQNIAEFQASLQGLTGRELYEMQMLCMVNRYLIDRPLDYAFHRAILNYAIKPIEVMRNCLLDGFVFIKVSDATHIKIEQYASRGEWGAFDDKLNFVETRYVYSEGNRDLWHVEHYRKNPDGTAIWTIFNPVTDIAIDKPDQWTIAEQIDLPYFPYVGIRWVDSLSFLSPMRSTIVRLEAAYQVIGAENIERMGLSLYIEGVTNVEDIKTAPRKMGRRVHLLPKDAKFHSPATDAPGMELMVIEIENLQAAIERASGVVSTEKLASLSGVSRQIAEKPLIVLVEEIRNLFTAGMLDVVELAATVSAAPELEISYKSLREPLPRTLQEQITLLDMALAKEYIDDTEYGNEIRLLLDLNATRK